MLFHVGFQLHCALVSCALCLLGPVVDPKIELGVRLLKQARIHIGGLPWLCRRWLGFLGGEDDVRLGLRVYEMRLRDDWIL